MNYLVCGYLAQHYISLIQIIAIINSCNINLTLIYINSILKVRLFDVIMMSATVNFFVIAHNADISIHALTRSATANGREDGFCGQISIHALTRDATRIIFINEFHLAISIHALAKSANVKHRSFYQTRRYFNPCTREECDLHQPVLKRIDTLFQSTHSRGVRLFATA